jgi:polyphosphate kinase
VDIEPLRTSALSWSRCSTDPAGNRSDRVPTKNRESWPGHHCFGGGHELPSTEAKVYLSSADWMPRNLDRRIEHLVPIENPTVHRQILEGIVGANRRDDSQIWYLQPDRTYLRSKPGDSPFEAHRYFMSSPSLSGRGTALKDQPLT